MLTWPLGLGTYQPQHLLATQGEQVTMRLGTEKEGCYSCQHLTYPEDTLREPKLWFVWLKALWTPARARTRTKLALLIPSSILVTSDVYLHLGVLWGTFR